uniref:tRNA-splicing endonuclease subunit Sen34 n=1 Tax=Plectus sambesii TaxID=2011161 RepID=A0A914XG04_9BILA
MADDEGSNQMMQEQEEQRMADDLNSTACISNVDNSTDADRCISPIQIESSNDGFLIFDLEDAKILRSCHRMVGTAIGTSPSTPAQNDTLTLPLLLFAEQVAVLLEYGYARLVRLLSTHPTDKDRNLYEHYLTQQKAQVAETLHKARIEEQLQMAEKIAKGRLAKKLKVKSSSAGATSKSLKVSDAEVSAISVTEEDIEAVRRELRLTKPPVLADDAVPVETCLTTSPLFSPDYDHIDVFDFPRTPQQRIRFTVFRDLWRKGYYLTPGVKFGCDFLVYPGDPLKFHATCMAICVKSDESLTPVELAGYSRVATQVKKTVLICSVAPDSDAPYYVSLNWWKG